MGHNHVTEKIGKPATIALPIIIGSLFSLLCLYVQSHCNTKQHLPSQNHETTATTTAQNKTRDKAWSLLPLVYCAYLSSAELIETAHGKETPTTVLMSYLGILGYAIVPTLITATDCCAGLAKSLARVSQQLFSGGCRSKQATSPRNDPAAVTLIR